MNKSDSIDWNKTLNDCKAALTSQFWSVLELVMGSVAVSGMGSVKGSVMWLVMGSIWGQAIISSHKRLVNDNGQWSC